MSAGKRGARSTRVSRPRKNRAAGTSPKADPKRSVAKTSAARHLRGTYDVMLQSVTRFALESGLAEDDVLSVILDLHTRVSQGESLYSRAPNYGGLSERVMGAYAQWWTDPDYLENGAPAALRVRGAAPSVESLLRAHVDAGELEAGMKLMGDSPGIKAESGKMWRATSAAFLSPPYHNNSLDRVARVFAGWLATLRLNSSVVDKSDGMFEQTLVTTAIPVSYLPILKRTARDLLSQSLQALYTPMLRAERRPGPKIKGEVGIQVFMYQLPASAENPEKRRVPSTPLEE